MPLHIELHLAAEKIIRIEITEHQIGVGHRRLRAALAIAHRAGIGARAVRPDFEQSERIDPGDAAAAGADLDHVDDRNAHRQTAALAEAIDAVDFEFVGLERLAVVDDAKLGGRAAHVEGK